MYTLVNPPPRVNWLYHLRAQRMDRRPPHRRATRQDAGRLEFDQRPYLQSWPAHGLRWLGAARQSRLGLCRRLPYFRRTEQRIGEGDDDLPRPRRPLTVTRSNGAIPCARPSSRARSAWGFRATPTTTAPFRKASTTPAHHPERPAHERRARLPASGDGSGRTLTCARTRMRPN